MSSCGVAPESSGLFPESHDAARDRCVAELEFVQALANPDYLHFLSLAGYFAKTEFVNYLSYLQYWKRKEYASLIQYPQCLRILDLLQDLSFRDCLGNKESIGFLKRRQLAHWQSYRNQNLLVMQLNAPITASLGAVQSVKESRLHEKLDNQKTKYAPGSNIGYNAAKTEIRALPKTSSFSSTSKATSVIGEEQTGNVTSTPVFGVAPGIATLTKSRAEPLVDDCLMLCDSDQTDQVKVNISAVSFPTKSNQEENILASSENLQSSVTEDNGFTVSLQPPEDFSFGDVQKSYSLEDQRLLSIASGEKKHILDTNEEITRENNSN